MRKEPRPHTKSDEGLITELTELLVKLAKAADSLPPNTSLVKAAEVLARYVVNSFPNVTKKMLVETLREEVGAALRDGTPTWVVCLKVSTRLGKMKKDSP